MEMQFSKLFKSVNNSVPVFDHVLDFRFDLHVAQGKSEITSKEYLLIWL